MDCHKSSLVAWLASFLLSTTKLLFTNRFLCARNDSFISLLHRFLLVAFLIFFLASITHSPGLSIERVLSKKVKWGELNLDSTFLKALVTSSFVRIFCFFKDGELSRKFMSAFSPSISDYFLTSKSFHASTETTSSFSF